MTIEHAEVVLPCADLDETLRFFTARLRFRLVSIWPADAPTTAVVEGFGARLRLRQGLGGSAGALHLTVDDAAAFAQAVGAVDGCAWAPNGTRIEFAEVRPVPVLPPLPAAPVTVTACASAAPWQTGRAGMRYRDLLPGRLGGRCIASLIRIDEGGPVPDYVHFHRVAVQLLYCVRGRIDVAYEHQGPPLQMLPGDCVLQPPTIRHRVLACLAGSEVVEFACPAAHETIVAPDVELPGDHLDAGREYGGQRFVHDRARDALWSRSDAGGWSVRELAVGTATGGLARARVRRCASAGAATPTRTGGAAADTGVRFGYVVSGAVVVTGGDGGTVELAAGDARTSTAAYEPAWASVAPATEVLEISLR